jgi:hypothetical protein
VRALTVAGLAALAALWPGCLCIAEFPEELIKRDGARVDRPRADGVPGDVTDGPRTPDGPRPPDGPRAEPLKPDLVAVTQLTCSSSGANSADCPDVGICEVKCSDQCARIRCQSATACRVNCSGPTPALTSIACQNAKQCHIRCENGACEPTGIDCGTGFCDVLCAGPSACNVSVECRNACRCNVECQPGACTAGIRWCKSGCLAPPGCDGKKSACNTCAP